MSDRYEIKAELGRGGLGVVYRAFDNQLGREVALKRVSIDSDEPVDQLTEDLISEAKTLSSLNHPNIVTIHDVGRDDEGPFVVMEMLAGETLETVIERGPLGVEDLKELAVQSIEGLIAAQSVDLLHLDLKPANIMIVWLPSGKFQVKILDFGLAMFAKQPTRQELGEDDSILGSIFFMAPEQFERRPLDGRTDLYSLGAILYATLAADYPFNGDTAQDVMAAHLQHRFAPLREVRPDIPDSICIWVEWLMARSPDERPANAQAALDGWSPDPVLDDTQFHEAASNDPALAAELLAGFVEETGELTRQLLALLNEARGPEAVETARTIRGAASTLGYAEIIALASEIEEKAAADPQSCLPAAARFPHAVSRLQQAVREARWETATEAGSTTEAKILIADDARIMRAVISRKLAEHGYAVTAVENGLEAIEAVEREPFDLVLLDIHMPELDGIGALRRLRERHSAASLPIIIATARDDDSEVVGAFELGANDFVTKPINFPVLFARLDTQLKLKRATEELARLSEKL